MLKTEIGMDAMAENELKKRIIKALEQVVTRAIVAGKNVVEYDGVVWLR